MPSDAHPILSSSIWAYLPLGLLCVVGLIWLLKLILSKRQSETEPTQNQPLEVVSNQRLAGIVVVDGKRFISCKWDGVMVCWNGGPFSSNPWMES